MSDEYSKVNFPELRKYKKIIKSGFSSEAELRKNIHEKYPEYEDMDTLLKYELWGDCLALEYSIKTSKDYFNKRTVKNYYIENENLFNFLLNTSVKIDDIIIKEIFSEDIKNDDPENGFFCFYMWIHSKGLKNSILVEVAVGKNGSADSMIIFSDGNKLKSACYLKCYFEGFYNHIETNPELYKYAKLILNLLFYMSAFPENVLNRPPDEVCDKLNKDNSKTISLSKDIADYLHENRDVSPHLRRGHFRYLASDRFKNKQFQTVFVKSSFVKGEAKTIIGEKEV